MLRKILAPLKDGPNIPVNSNSSTIASTTSTFASTVDISQQKSVSNMSPSSPKNLGVRNRRGDLRGKENHLVTSTSTTSIHISEPSDFKLIAHVECDPNTGHYKGIDEFMTLATLPRGRRSPVKRPNSIHTNSNSNTNDGNDDSTIDSLPLPPTRSIHSLLAERTAAASVVNITDEESNGNNNNSDDTGNTSTSTGNPGSPVTPSASRPPRLPKRPPPLTSSNNNNPLRSSPVTPTNGGKLSSTTARRGGNKNKISNVSMPIRTRHVVHVRLDPSNPTGFAGLPLAWERILLFSGILPHEALANPEAVIDVLNFSSHSASDDQQQQLLTDESVTQSNEPEVEEDVDDDQPDVSASSLRALPPICLEKMPSVTSFDEASDGMLEPPSASSNTSTPQRSIDVRVYEEDDEGDKKEIETMEVNEDYMENFIGAERKTNLPDGIPDYVDSYFRDDDPNELFSRLEHIGEGSCGNVYRAINKKDGTFVALKKVVPENERDWKLYKFEVYVMKEHSRSDNLVNCYDAFRHNNDLWIVMEYVSAGTLADLLSTRRQLNNTNTMNEEVIAFICREVLNGLQALHEIRRVHRDIKGDNILLDMDGSVKVADFGFCAELSEKSGKRNTVVGTPFWMAPEVIRGSNYDTMVDIWSTGILALECTQGKPPHLGVAPIRAMFLIATQGAPQLSEDTPASAELRDFIDRCCSLAPGRRPCAEQALKHPFIQKACSKEDAAAYFNEACEQKMQLKMVQ